MTGTPVAYCAPAGKVLTELHKVSPDPDLAGAVTVCGLPMDADGLWLEVEPRDGDRLCPGCLNPDAIPDTETGLW